MRSGADETKGRWLCASTMLFAWGLAAAVSPFAAAGPEANLRECAAERDDRRRLACYDAVVLRLGNGALETSTEKPEVSPASSREGQNSDAADDFGMTPALARRMKGQGQEGQEEPDSLAAVVTRIDEKPYGERILYLDNGQVWEETSRNRNLPVAVGDEITVKSAAFGSYKLVGPGGKRFTRVRRIG